MKKATIAVMLCLIITGSALAQIEQGDKEISFMGYFSTFVGENVEPNGVGSVQISYGNYVTPFFQVGIAPTFTFVTADDENGDPMVDVQISGSAFFNLNFATASKTIPYITGQFYQYTFDIPEGQEFSDYSYVNVGLGVKSFFNEYAAFNTLVTYGFSLAQEAEGGIIMIMTGLTFLF